jgi:hypothetical protein
MRVKNGGKYACGKKLQKRFAIARWIFSIGMVFAHPDGGRSCAGWRRLGRCAGDAWPVALKASSAAVSRAFTGQQG